MKPTLQARFRDEFRSQLRKAVEEGNRESRLLPLPGGLFGVRQTTRVERDGKVATVSVVQEGSLVSKFRMIQRADRHWQIVAFDREWLLYGIGQSPSGASSRVAATKGNMKDIATALESYFVDKDRYPGLLAWLEPNYLRAIPTDPCTNYPYTYEPVGEPPTNYILSIDFASTQGGTGDSCYALVHGLMYTPSGGLQEKP